MEYYIVDGKFYYENKPDILIIKYMLCFTTESEKLITLSYINDEYNEIVLTLFYKNNLNKSTFILNFQNFIKKWDSYNVETIINDKWLMLGLYNDITNIINEINNTEFDDYSSNIDRIIDGIIYYKNDHPSEIEKLSIFGICDNEKICCSFSYKDYTYNMTILENGFDGYLFHIPFSLFLRLKNKQYSHSINILHDSVLFLNLCRDIEKVIKTFILIDSKFITPNIKSAASKIDLE